MVPKLDRGIGVCAQDRIRYIRLGPGMCHGEMTSGGRREPVLARTTCPGQSLNVGD